MMAIDTRDLTRLDADFESGRNPRAYIPLCQALRRDRRLIWALELCQRGLELDGDSLAGWLLYVRTLFDLGRYDEALEVISRAQNRFGQTAGLLVEALRCQIRLMQAAEAEATYRQLDELNPFDPRLRLLCNELRELTARSAPRHSAEVRTGLASHHDLARVTAALARQLEGLGKVHTIAIVDLDSSKTVVEGDAALVEAAEELYGEATIACDELGQGIVAHAMVELRGALVLVLRRDRRLVVVAVDPRLNFGKLHHRVQLVLQHYLPTHDTVNDEDEDLEMP